MPSPVAHSLAGCAWALVALRWPGKPSARWQPALAVALANAADLDVTIGLVRGNPGEWHHQATHSFAAAIVVGLVAAVVASRRDLKAKAWGLWAGFVYLSHVQLDYFVADPVPPLGVQLFWPLSETYFMSPIPLFARFDYFDPHRGILGALFSWTNVATIAREVVLMVPILGLAWLISRTGRARP